MEEKCEAEGISLDSLDLVKSPMWQIKRARLGVYKSYCPTAEEGWLRYILEQYEFPYSSLENAAIRQGGLNSNFDTIIFPSQSEDIISHGISQNHYPQEYAGGLEEEGKFAISEFIENGGTCIFIDAAADWAVSQLGLQCVNVLAGKDNSIFFAPGSILRAIFDTEHPLAYGMSTETPVFFCEEGRGKQGKAWC